MISDFGIFLMILFMSYYNHFLKFGVNKTMLFDVQKRIWSHGPQMSHRRRLHGCAFVPETNKTRGQVIVVAGKHSEDTVESLDVVSKEWKIIGLK